VIAKLRCIYRERNGRDLWQKGKRSSALVRNTKVQPAIAVKITGDQMVRGLAATPRQHPLVILFLDNPLVGGLALHNSRRRECAKPIQVGELVKV
jgi:hypothetical protein